MTPPIVTMTDGRLGGQGVEAAAQRSIAAIFGCALHARNAYDRGKARNFVPAAEGLGRTRQRAVRQAEMIAETTLGERRGLVPRNRESYHRGTDLVRISLYGCAPSRQKTGTERP
jgi:hypothetical protein